MYARPAGLVSPASGFDKFQLTVVESVGPTGRSCYGERVVWRARDISTHDRPLQRPWLYHGDLLLDESEERLYVVVAKSRGSMILVHLYAQRVQDSDGPGITVRPLLTDKVPREGHSFPIAEGSASDFFAEVEPPDVAKVTLRRSGDTLAIDFVRNGEAERGPRFVYDIGSRHPVLRKADP